MDTKGSSLPSMPEPASPISMKQPPDSLGVRKGRADLGSDPSLLMDKAAAQLAATLHDSVLHKMAGHNNNHERLKDLTARVLNGDQDLCAPEPPMLKGAEAPATNGTHQRSRSPAHAESELKVTVPKVVERPPAAPFEPRCANGTGLATDAAAAALSAPENRQEVKKRGGRPVKPKPPPNHGATFTPLEQSDVTKTGAEAAHQLSPAPAFKATQPPPLLIRFSVGDLVWTKVSGYPWWPCMVTTDPEFSNHFKQKQKAVNSRSGLLYHVQYFGDAPERGYIFEKNMVSFTGEDQFQVLSQSNKQAAAANAHKKSAPSIPRKLKAQWNMGIIQAKEAVCMSRDQRMLNFSFQYSDDGPHLNQRIMDKLRPKPHEEALGGPDAAAEWRLGPPPPSKLDPTAPEPPSQSEAAAAPPKKKRRPRQPQSPTKTAAARRQKKAAAAASDASDPVKKRRRSKMAAAAAPTEEADADAASLPLPVPGEKVKKRRKKQAPAEQSPGPTVKKERKKRQRADATADKEPQPKRRRKMNKEAEKQASSAEGAGKKRRTWKKDDAEVKPVKRRQKKAKEPPTGDEDAEKPKRRRKRKQDGENQAPPAKTKKRRRASPCLDPEGSGSEGRPDSPSDSLDGTKKGERKKEFVCQVCEQAGEDLVPCEGQCCGMFHLQCLGPTLKPDDKLLCQECSTGIRPCFSCKQSEGKLRRCHVLHCGKFYHEACARLSPLTLFDNKGFRCPMHTCLSCFYGCRAKHKSTKGRLMRCLRCPVAYHMGDLCVAAGSEMITNTAIICTNHFHAKKGYSHHSHVNVSWCFVCSKGGQLLCCESCPAAFHPDCLNIAMPDGSWFCNDCRAGKKPRYRDIIWVKLGTYRWWPAEIYHPRNIPTNIQHLRHEIGEFPVFFFGSKDYFWTHQGRVFPYMEGDRGSKHQRTGIGKVFKNALLEAEARFKEIKMKREAKEAQENSRKPPPYKVIKVNKPVGRVQLYAADISEIPKCNCKPTDERPCGFDSECLNRMLQYECHPQVCPNGGRCCNQDFTLRLYPETKIIRTPGKGWGLVALRDIKKGEFVNEYIGELIDEEECRARIKSAHENNITNFYMLTIDKDRIIDAGPKGNYSRFMNHSCQPNCETQKWTVNGDTRVGLFAVRDIPAGTELTFNYNLDCLGNEKTECRCGASNCSGFLGDRPKNSNGPTTEPKAKRLKRKYKKRKTEGKKKSDDDCFRCRDGGQLVLCDKKSCTKAYHLSCLNLTKRPFGRWDCPWHHCDVCGKNSDAFCQLCPNSFCKAHQEGALRPWPPTGQLCCLEHEEPPEGTEIIAVAAPLAVTAAGPPRGPKGSRKSDGAEAKRKGSKRKAAEA